MTRLTLHQQRVIGITVALLARLRSPGERSDTRDKPAHAGTYRGATILVRSDIRPSNAITMSSPGRR